MTEVNVPFQYIFVSTGYENNLVESSYDFVDMPAGVSVLFVHSEGRCYLHSNKKCRALDKQPEAQRVRPLYEAIIEGLGGPDKVFSGICFTSERAMSLSDLPEVWRVLAMCEGEEEGQYGYCVMNHLSRLHLYALSPGGDKVLVAHIDAETGAGGF